MAVPESTRRYLDSHLQQAEFALKVASNFARLADTPALEEIQAALGKVGGARVWVREKLETEAPAMKPRNLPLGQGLPLTRRERMGYRWP
jgi:hypothetical protein